MSNDLLDLAAIRRCGIALPMTFMILAAAGAGFGARPAAAQVGETINEELLSLTGTQPALAADVRGGFVVIWTDTEAENEGLGIRGCLLEPKEGGCGPHFAVNTTAVGDQIRPSVAADDPGRFVVVWQNGYSPSALGAESTQVRGQRFGAGGVKLGPELHLSGSMPGDQEGPKVAMSEGGDFIVTWQSDQDNRVEVARFAASGKPVGPVFAMDTEGQSNVSATVARGLRAIGRKIRLFGCRRRSLRCVGPTGGEDRTSGWRPELRCRSAVGKPGGFSRDLRQL